MLSRIANFDDADPLRVDPGVDFAFVPPGQPVPRDADVVVLFGTKSTVGELAFLRAQGWDHDVIAHARTGGRVLGVCGGYQMLGRRVHDPAGVDGPAGAADGLGLLDVETTMAGEKTLRRADGRCALTGEPVSGYEIHMGQTRGPDLARPMLQLDTGSDGARDASGRVEGTYLHGLLANDAWRRAWLARAGAATDAHTGPVTAGAPNHRSAEEAPGRASNCRSVSMRWFSASMRPPSSAREASMR